MQDTQSANQQAQVVQDKAQQVDFDFGMAIEKVDSWIDGLVRLIPNIITAVVIFTLFYFLGKFYKRW